MKSNLSTVFLLLFGIVFLVPGHLRGADLEATTQKLDQIAAEIQELSAQDKSLGRELAKAEKQLRKSDRALSKASAEARRISKKLQRKKAEVAELELQTAETRQKIARLKADIRKSLLALQKLGESSPAKKILSPEDVAAGQRQAYWFRYLTRLKQEQIAAASAAEAELLRLEDQQREALARLEELNAQWKKEEKALAAARAENRRLAKKLKKKRSRGKAALALLKADQARLGTLLERLRFAEAYPEFATDGKTPFSKLKGKLSWPVKGRVRASSFSKGVTIAVPGGTKVRAVSHGRVVYADWMRGFGLLLIIDHGDGYMSLYGRNESLFKRRGDWVEPGTVIAASGRSGGADADGLYFEIRKNAQSLDPRKWCRLQQ